MVVSTRSTKAPVSSATFGWRSAGVTHTTCASALACTRQGKPSQVAQRMQALSCGFPSSSMMPTGSWERPQAGTRQIVRQLLDARLMRYRRVGIGILARRLGRVAAALAVHVIEPLGRAVIGRQVA